MGSTATVLIVLDEPTKASGLKAKVESLGYRAVVSGADASEEGTVAELSAVDIALVGVTPEDAYRGIKAARAVQSRIDVPVIHLCPYVDEEMMQRTSQGAPCARLVEPVHEGALYSAIELALRQHRTDAGPNSGKLPLQAEAARQGDGTQRLERMAGAVSHNFNGIIQTILGNAELIEADVPDDAHVRQEVTEIIKACHKATGITRQLLAYVGHIPLRSAEVDLSKLVERVKPRLRSMAAESVIIRCHLADGLPPVQADAERVRQILENIFINSVESLGPNGGEISIITEAMEAPPEDPCMLLPLSGACGGRFAVLEVRDNGCGIDKENLRRIFDPFFTTKFIGRGLGLSLVLGAVRQHMGFVGVSSAPGAGTRVVVGLPASQQNGDPPALHKQP